MILITFEMKRTFAFFCLVLGGLLAASASMRASAAVPVRGVVTDAADGEPLIGVAVSVKGTLTGTVTDDDGSYFLEVPDENAVLVYSIIGYVEHEEQVMSRGVIDVSMLVDAIMMDEIVVVGYGTQKRSDVTGAVASISKERLSSPGNVTVAQALQGAVPGVMISTSSAGADPGNQTIMIRGRKSISASNEPLIVLDGIPYAGSISDISPNDIESLEVLKDASSAAIYGSRGSNGVILITTRTGEADGQVKINYDGYFQLDVVSRFPELMGPEEYYQYMKLRQEAGISTSLDPNEVANYERGVSTDWTDVLLKNGTGQNHRLSVSGGFKNTKFLVSGSFLDNRGVAVNDNYSRATGRINISTKIRPWLSFGTNTSFSYSKKDGNSANINQLLQTSPLASAFNDDGSIKLNVYVNNEKWRNPLEWTLYESTNHRQQLVSNNYLNVDFPFVKGLSYRINAGIAYRWQDKSYYMPSYTVGGSDPGNTISYISNYMNSSWTIEHLLNYQRTFGKHNIFLTALYSFESESGETRYVEASGFTNDFLGYYGMSSAKQLAVDFGNGAGTKKSSLISRMFRANYSYDSRYLFTFTFRQDGYSGFARNRKWGTFPSVALGWNIANEGFFSKARDIMNEFKLRLSWGINGNQAISPYQSMESVSNQNGVDDSGSLLEGYLVTGMGNDYLGWETTRSFNVGVDYAFLESRIFGSVEYYNSHTSDLLLKRTISSVHGDTDIFENIGRTANYGVEFMINSNNIVKNNFNWSTTLSVAYNRNRIVDLYGNGADDIASKWFIGSPVDVNYDYKIIGVWQESEAEEAAKYGAKPGYAKYYDAVKVDADGNPITRINADDKVILGSRTPVVITGMQNTFTYKNWSLSFFLYGQFGAWRENPLTDSKYLLSRQWWTPETPTNDYWSMDVDATEYCGGTQIKYERTDFVRLKDITLSYTLPEKLMQRWKVDKVMVYFTGRNLFTVTGYGGFDPELTDSTVIPVSRSFVFGLNLMF